ncbi:glycoside hydrolase N-terminal domain-containing protein [Cellulomonas sp. JH27-2]|uniref:glycosyl hydrolase family 95 catalytic domain-containing protein n=1 Tax=Cellulomonas sp. JH27-2 TaxID=2774139 RepID=UPI001782CF85|nr:glycoside hydrolase N-terminal domain-containing protein [Cellulomonas sp. JH27-2]MBD8059837.1 glycoside hydrolase N-terminal domain-containing protein [Cellulomonas sp. JH27-2]
MSSDVLRFAEPARRWEEAFPLGNGRLGAMVHGGVEAARVQVNDATAWSGRPDGPATALAELMAAGVGPGTLDDLRTSLDEGRDGDAVRLAQRFQGPWAQAYQPFVDLTVSVQPGLRYAGRTLDLATGVVSERLVDAGREITATWFTSALDGALHGRWQATGGRFRWSAALTSPHPLHGQGLRDGRVVGRRVRVDLPVDVSPTHEPLAPGVTHGAPGEGLTGVAVQLVSTDGTSAVDGEQLVVDGATWIELVLITGTTSPWPASGPLRPVAVVQAETSARATRALPTDRAAGDAAERDHTREHADRLGGTSLRLGPPVDLLLPSALDEAPQPALAQAVFAFGRYLLLASSRPGSPPVTLQGLWNQDLQPPWSSAYTLNINLEMAYWAAESAGLSSCHDALFDHLGLLAEQGTAVARDLYGCRGWVAHHNSDVWGWALPVGGGHGDPAWASWWSGGPWLCRHLWDRYEHTLDRAFLRDVAWPLMVGAAQFCLDWLRPDGAGGLVPHPSTSPENARLRGGRAVALCAGSTMDVALTRDLLEHVVEAAAVLGLGQDVADECAAALALLPHPSVGPDGLLREWPDDAPAQDPHHRHLSHLVGLYPLGQIDVERTPALAGAAARSLAARGPGSTGWSMAWKAALHARLGDGPGVGDVLAGALVRAPEQPDGPWAGGLLPNLFSTHPPFQVDGNLGLVAAMVEALVGSSRTQLRLLPALPPQWPDGEARGLRVRGGLSVDLRWEHGALVEAALHPDVDQTREVRLADRTCTVRLAAGRPVRLDATLATPDLVGRA